MALPGASSTQEECLRWSTFASRPAITAALLVLTIAVFPPEDAASSDDRAASAKRLDAVIASGRQSSVRKLVSQSPLLLTHATPQQRAKLIDILQRRGTGSADERTILDIVAASPQTELAEVLKLIDAGDDQYDLEELVYHDVDDPEVRQKLLDLIASQRSGQAALELGVISDFDDTAVPHKHKPFGDAAPGVAALYVEIDGELPGDVHFVTARPQVVGQEVRQQLRQRGFPSATVKFGHFDRVVFGGGEGILSSKVANIERLMALHPQQRFVLFGDTVQQDPEVYREIQRRHPEQVAAVVIFNATGLAADDSRCQEFILAGNSVEAAAKLAQLGLLSEEQVRVIARAAIAEGLPHEQAEQWLPDEPPPAPASAVAATDP